MIRVYERNGSMKSIRQRVFRRASSSNLTECLALKIGDRWAKVLSFLMTDKNREVMFYG